MQRLRGEIPWSLCITINSKTTNTIISMSWLQLPQILITSLCFSFPFLTLGINPTICLYLRTDLYSTCTSYLLSGLSLCCTVLHWCYISELQTYLKHYSSISWVCLFRVHIKLILYKTFHALCLCLNALVLSDSLKFITDFLDKLGQVIIPPASSFPTIKWKA